MMAAAAPAPHGGAEPVLLAAPGLSLDDLEVLARDPSGALMDRPALDGVDSPAAMVVGRRAGCPGCVQESLATRKALAAEYPGLTVIGIDRDDLPMPGPSADLPRAQRRIKDYRRCSACLRLDYLSPCPRICVVFLDRYARAVLFHPGDADRRQAQRLGQDPRFAAFLAGRPTTRPSGEAGLEAILRGLDERGERFADIASAPAAIAIDPGFVQALAQAGRSHAGMNEVGATIHRPTAEDFARTGLASGQARRASADEIDLQAGRYVLGAASFHTHPDDSFFSARDVVVSARSGRPALLATASGAVWMLLPTWRLQRRVNWSQEENFQALAFFAVCRPPQMTQDLTLPMSSGLAERLGVAVYRYEGGALTKLAPPASPDATPDAPLSPFAAFVVSAVAHDQAAELAGGDKTDPPARYEDALLDWCRLTCSPQSLAALQASPPGLLAQADRALDQDEGLWTSSSAFFVSLAAAPYLEILSRKDRRQDADCSSLTLLWGEPKDGAPQPPQGGFIQDPTGRRRPRFPDKPMYRTDSPNG